MKYLMPDSVFLEEFVKPRNWGFNTVAGNEEVKEKNSIRACIYQTVTITDGQEVGLVVQLHIAQQNGVATRFRKGNRAPLRHAGTF